MNGVSFNSKSVLGDKIALQQLDESKQDKLTFDTTPTIGSSNPVTSGGIASAISEIEIPEFKLTNKIWTPTHWKVERDGEVHSFDNYMVAAGIWTDGDNIYYDHPSIGSFVLDKSTSTWLEKEWNGYPLDYGMSVWTDGENYYGVSETTTNVFVSIVLNKSTSTWETKTWYGLPEDFAVYGEMVWTDGDNIYFSYNLDSEKSYNYVLDKSTSTWSVKEWNGYPPYLGDSVWTDGENFYSSAYDEENEETFHTVLDKTTSTWSRKTWYGLSETTIYPSQPDVVDGLNVWTEGEDIYYLSVYSKNQYVLDKSTSTWNIIGNYGFASLTSDYDKVIWTDGDNTYYTNNHDVNGINYVFGPKYLEIKTSSITANVPLVDLGPNITKSDIAPEPDQGDDGDIWFWYKN